MLRLKIMANIYNSELTKEIVEGAKLQLMRDSPPSQISDKIVVCMETNPKIVKESTVLASLNRSTTASAITIMPANVDNDVYITGITLGNLQDATSDNTSIGIVATVGGANRNIYLKRKTTLTAMSTVEFLSFSNPLKIDRNTPILLNLTFTAGTSNTDIVIYGFTLNAKS